MCFLCHPTRPRQTGFAWHRFVTVHTFNNNTMSGPPAPDASPSDTSAEATVPPVSLLSLPPEVLLDSILPILSTDDILSLSSTSKVLHSLCVGHRLLLSPNPLANVATRMTRRYGAPRRGKTSAIAPRRSRRPTTRLRTGTNASTWVSAGHAPTSGDRRASPAWGGPRVYAPTRACRSPSARLSTHPWT